MIKDDTPPWSPFRKIITCVAILIGTLMIARGAFMSPENSDTAKELIAQGADLIGWVFMFIIIGASSERMALWLPLRTVKGTPPA
ncbi:MAG: hypothetical protein GC184_06095 [Rhizobiales bacterium]|nr:hypothetical protein [Hyphomicrobiales bacterium]